MAVRAQAGQPLSARVINAILDGLRACRVVAGQNVRVHRTPAGQVVEVALPQEADFVISGGDGAGRYAGNEVYAALAGGWPLLPGGRTCTVAADPLCERNASATVTTGAFVHARRDPRSGAWIFDRITC